MREIHSKAAHLFSVCFFFIILYSAATLVFALHSEDVYESIRLLPSMLHSTAISAVIALGGTLLLDLELAAYKN